MTHRPKPPPPPPLGPPDVPAVASDALAFPGGDALAAGLELADLGASDTNPVSMHGARGRSAAELEIDVGGDDTHLVIELMPDGRLRAPVQAARELLRDRLRRAEALRTGPEWCVLRTLDPVGLKAQGKAESREVVAAGVIREGAISLIDFIGFLASALQTGMLTVAQGQTERSVYMYRGDVVWASSNSGEDRLGEFLLRRGKLTREQLQQAVRDGDRRLGRACVERGFLPAHELYGLIQAQLTEIFDKVLAAETGVWSFAHLSEEVLGESQIHLSTQGLLVDALRRLDEMKIYRQRIRNAEVHLQRVGKAPDISDPSLTFEEGLRESGSKLLAVLQAHGAHSIAELMRLLGRSEFEVTRTAYHLMKKGMVEIVHAHETSPIPRRVAALSKQEASEIVGIYAMAIREMFTEVARLGQAEALVSAANGFLGDASGADPILGSCALAADGTLQEASLQAALQDVAVDSQSLSDSLSELMFFVLFQATEYLGRRRGDDLARRVKLILGMLGSTGVKFDDSKGA